MQKKQNTTDSHSSSTHSFSSFLHRIRKSSKFLLPIAFFGILSHGCVSGSESIHQNFSISSSSEKSEAVKRTNGEEAIKRFYDNFFMVRLDGAQPEKNMDRTYTDPFLSFMHERREKFKSSDNTTLQGYWYIPVVGDKEEEHPKGVIISAHGLGGSGAKPAIGAYATFAMDGFLVFAFDTTGTGESEGTGLHGLTQGAKDLDDAINFVKSKENLKNVPIHLYGGSMGGFSVLSVLNKHTDDITSVVSLCPFDDPVEILTDLAMKTIENEDAKKFSKEEFHDILLNREIRNAGLTLKNSATRGIDSAPNTKVMIIHGILDTTVPISLGLDKIASGVKDPSKLTLLRMEGLDHALDDTMPKRALEFFNSNNEKSIDLSLLLNLSENKF